MLTKRRHEEVDDQPAVHPSRQSQVTSSDPPVSKKPRRIEPSPKASSSMNGIKKRIRDISRRLRSENLPADVRVENERALGTYEQELEAAQAEKMRQKMISKYHMVRFFERQKAIKQLKKLKKRLLSAESPEEVEEIKRLTHISEVDLNYSQYFPLAEKYVSLFASVDSKAEEPTERKKPPMWVEVERRMEEGTLDELKNRAGPAAAKPKATVLPSKKVQAIPKAQSKPKEPVIITGNRRERRRLEGKTKTKSRERTKKGVKSYEVQGVTTVGPETDGGSDGGGFFEE